MSKLITGCQIWISATAAAALLFAVTGCEQLPGTNKQQGAAIGGVGGAVAGAAVAGEHHRVLGAVLGGALGAGGGYIIGANTDKLKGHERYSAEEAVRNAQSNPATVEQARMSQSADLNNDGFVTMDEVVAMRQAGLPDQAMVDRLRATGQVFDLTAEQQDYLRTQGVSQFVLSQMSQINRDRFSSPTNDGRVIGRPQP